MVVNQQSTLDSDKEKTDVEQGINTSELKPKEFLVQHKSELARKGLDSVNSPDELIDGKPFKVTSANKALVQALLDGTSLSNIIYSAPHYWEVPVLLKNNLNPVASYTVDVLEDKWQVVEVGGYLSPVDSNFSSNPKDIANFLENNGLKDANQFAHVRIPSLHMDLLYIESNNQEYFIPLIHGRDELYGLKNRQLYTRDQLVSAIGPPLKEVMANPNLLTGVPEANKKWSSGNIITFIGIGVVLVVGMIILYRKIQMNRDTT